MRLKTAFLTLTAAMIGCSNVAAQNMLSNLLGKTLQCDTELLYFSKSKKLLWSLAEVPERGATTRLYVKNIIENSEDTLTLKIDKPFVVSPNFYTLKGPLTIHRTGSGFSYQNYKLNAACTINGRANTMQDYQKSSASIWACGQDPSKKCLKKFYKRCGSNPSEQCGKREGRRNKLF